MNFSSQHLLSGLLLDQITFLYLPRALLTGRVSVFALSLDFARELPYTLACLWRVSALIAASPTAFFVIQCLGAAYLLYLAYKSFGVRAGVVVSSEFGIRNSESCHPERNAVESKDPVKSSDAISGVPSARSLYMRGIIMNLTNPKVILFVLSLIPPAVRLDRPIHPSLQMAIFGGEFILATMIVFGSIALLAGTVKKFLLTSPKANRNLNWFSGAVFVFLAVALFAL